MLFLLREPKKVAQPLSHEIRATVDRRGHHIAISPARRAAGAQGAGGRADVGEIEDIGMMATRALTYTFDGPGPYAYACHLECLGCGINLRQATVNYQKIWSIRALLVMLLKSTSYNLSN